MLFNRLHRLRSKEEDESGTDTLEDIQEEEDIDPENPDGEPHAEEEQEGETASEDELIVTIEGAEQDEEEAKAPNWVKELRKKNREDQKRIRELEERLAQGSAPQSDDPGKEPELEDFDYDADAFKAAYRDWTAKKVEADKRKEERRKAQEEIEREWSEVIEKHQKEAAKFDKSAMAEAVAELEGVLPQDRRAMIIDMPGDTAALTLALGSRPEKLRQLASIKSQVKFIAALADFQKEIKVQSKKTPPPPERTISGSGKSPGATANNLDKLKAEAEKTGNYEKYHAEKRRLGK